MNTMTLKKMIPALVVCASLLVPMTSQALTVDEMAVLPSESTSDGGGTDGGGTTGCELIDKRLRSSGKFDNLDKKEVKGEPYKELAENARKNINSRDENKKRKLELAGLLTKAGLHEFENAEFEIKKVKIEKGTFKAAHFLVFFESDVKNPNKDCKILCKEKLTMENIEGKPPRVEERPEFEVPIGEFAKVVELAKPDKATHRLIHVDFPGTLSQVKPIMNNAPHGASLRVEATCRLKDVKDSDVNMDLKISISKDGKVGVTLNGKEAK